MALNRRAGCAKKMPKLSRAYARKLIRFLGGAQLRQKRQKFCPGAVPAAASARPDQNPRAVAALVIELV